MVAMAMVHHAKGAWMKVTISMGKAGNGVPVFVVPAAAVELQRPFGASWDADRHVWMFPAYYPSSKKVLADLEVLNNEPGARLQLEFSNTAKDYIKQLDEVERRYQKQILPEGFTFVTKPFAHQVLGLCHVFYLLRSGLFFDPGLGKSKVAIDLVRLLHFRGDKRPVIILGPLVTVKNWGKEIDKHSGGALRWLSLLGTPKQKAEIIERTAAGEADVLLLTYDTARNFVDSIVTKVNYATVIADESQRIKEWRSSRTKAVHEIGQKAARKVLMTGTPTLGSPLDLYGQFRFLGDYFMPENYFKYQQRFVKTSSANSHVVLGYKNLDILNARTLFITLRRSKAECLDLPPRMPPIDVEYDLSRHQSVIYNQLVAEMTIDIELLIAQLGGLAEVGDAVPPQMILPHRAAMLNKLLQISSGFLIKNNQDNQLCDNAEPGGCRYLNDCVENNIRPYTKKCRVAPEAIPNTVTVFEENPKLEALTELLSTVLADPPNKVIVWCYYTQELNVVEERLQKEGYSYVRVDGKTGAKVQDLVDKFNEDPTVRVYLAQISTGVGITLNAATYMIYYALTYSLEAYLQSMDRNYRIGQTNNVTIYRLLGKQTVEPAITRLLDNKVDVDKVLTQKLSCIVCSHSLRCIAESIALFDPECVYQRNMARPVAKAYLIQIGAKP